MPAVMILSICGVDDYRSVSVIAAFEPSNKKLDGKLSNDEFFGVILY